MICSEKRQFEGLFLVPVKRALILVFEILETSPVPTCTACESEWAEAVWREDPEYVESEPDCSWLNITLWIWLNRLWLYILWWPSRWAVPHMAEYSQTGGSQRHGVRWAVLPQRFSQGTPPLPGVSDCPSQVEWINQAIRSLFNLNQRRRKRDGLEQRRSGKQMLCKPVSGVRDKWRGLIAVSLSWTRKSPTEPLTPTASPVKLFELSLWSPTPSPLSL